MGIRPNDGRSSQRPATPDSHLQGKHSFRSGMWQRFHHFFSKDQHNDNDSVQRPDQVSWPDQPPPLSKRDWSAVSVGVGLPRQATFRRQNSEKRDRLTLVEPTATERRALSSARASGSISIARRPRASSTPPLYHIERASAPAISSPSLRHDQPSDHQMPLSTSPAQDPQPDFCSNHVADDGTRPPRPPSITSSAMSYHQDLAEADVDEKALIKAELDTRWILNLSMHFRDKSNREKFFVTYAETPSKWRRVTVSCDYRNAELGSLEMDLKELQFQRDKSLQIYESIRDSLLEIQFYDTVTNLKLETSDGRLHVHVTEDVNETIPYPPRTTVTHILEDDEYRPLEICESELIFDSHLSGFVYKVTHNDRVYIKKEIPGPDTVDEFLYEINALHALHGSQNVIRLEAIVVDDTHQLVKGLLISYAEQGAIVDLLYDYKGKIEWEDRLRWARDSIVGLSEIHDQGYVQGDFTLSNIVVDAEGNAKIIDINRRGCPVGWEPPEIATKIASHQRISMYIGEKSDLYQLGMTLWGLAADDDEPERHDPPLSVDELPPHVPGWYREITRICLDPKPRNRRSARELATMFPAPEYLAQRRLSDSPHSVGFREQKRYIDPSAAVERADIERLGWNGDLPYSPESSRYDDTFTYPRSSNYDRHSDISEYERPRGRAPPRNLEHLNRNERRGWSLEEIAAPSASESEPQILSVSPGMGPQYDDVDIDGRPFLIARGTFNDEELELLDGRPRGRSRNALEDVTPTDSGQLTRPVYTSRTSASGSTPRHSQAILPSLSGERRGSVQGTSESGTIGTHPDFAAESYGGSALQPLAEERRISLSPQPPPSLSYADSGFCEPQDDDDIMLPLPSISTVAGEDVPTSQLGEDQSGTPLTASAKEHDTIGSKFPPRLERSDTIIRTGPAVADPNAGAQPADHPSGPVDPMPTLVVQDVDVPGASATTILEAMVPETQPKITDTEPSVSNAGVSSGEISEPKNGTVLDSSFASHDGSNAAAGEILSEGLSDPPRLQQNEPGPVSLSEADVAACENDASAVVSVETTEQPPSVLKPSEPMSEAESADERAHPLVDTVESPETAVLSDPPTGQQEESIRSTPEARPDAQVSKAQDTVEAPSVLAEGSIYLPKDESTQNLHSAEDQPG